MDGRKMALQDSCENGNESTVEVEADVHLQTNDWYATFYITCYKGHDGTAQLLLKNGADVILQTLLSIAIYNGHGVKAQLFLNMVLMKI